MNDKPMRLKAVCAASDTGPGTVRMYASKGLIDAERDSNGNWIFSVEAPEQIRKIRPNRPLRERRRLV